MTDDNAAEPTDTSEPTADATANTEPETATKAAGDGATDGPDAAAGDAKPGIDIGATAATILESIREAVDDLAERAGPTVKEFSAKAAEVAAVAADKAGPYARQAGEAAADASGKLAEKSRSWASDIRTSLGEAASAASDKAGDVVDAVTGKGDATDESAATVPEEPATEANDTPDAAG